MTLQKMMCPACKTREIIIPPTVEGLERVKTHCENCGKEVTIKYKQKRKADEIDW